MKLLEAEDLIASLVQQGLDGQGFSIADRTYACATKSWVNGMFAGALKQFLWEFSAEKWQVEVNDCDDMARAAAFYAQWLHLNTEGRPRATALAFGEFWYEQDEGGVHAINVAVCEDAELVFFEPQTQSLVTLSEAERTSCALVRF